MGKSKNGLIVFLVVFLVAGVFVYPKARWFQFEMKVRDAFADKSGLGRYPTSEQMIAVGPKLVTLANDLGFPGLKIEFELEYRVIGPVRFWYYKAAMRQGSHTFKCERRVERPFSPAELEWFREKGVTVPARHPGDDGKPDEDE